MKLDTKPTRHAPVSVRERPERVAGLATLLPGLGVASTVAAMAIVLSQLIDVKELKPLLLAVILGMTWRQVWVPPAYCRPGIRFSMRWVLRLAVVLLGLRLSMSDVLTSGVVGLAIVTVSTLSTFYFTCWLGRRLRIHRQLVQLIAAGTSVCGASAIVAANAVVEGSEEDVAYAVATITGFGTLAILAYPLLGTMFDFSSSTFGLWCGASIHEVAQVVATAFQHGTTSGELATLTKLTRVLLLVPIVIGLGVQRKGDRSSVRVQDRALPIPWFVLFFCGCVILNSLNIIPAGIKQALLVSNQGLLCLALAAMGLETNIGLIKQLGLKPIYLAGMSWMFLAGLSLSLIALLGV